MGNEIEEETITNSPRMKFHDSPSENALLQKVETGLEMAVRDLGLIWNDEERVKRQKFEWLGVLGFTEEDEEPITYSWFRLGSNMLAAPPAQETLSRGYTLYSEPARDTNLWTADAEEIAHFFKHDLSEFPLEEHWEDQFFEFLENFYELYAPEEYRDLYFANIRLRRQLDLTLDVINGRVEDDLVEIYEEVGRINAQIQMELAGNDSFRSAISGLMEQEPGTEDKVLDFFINYSDLVENVFLALSHRDYEDLGSKDEEVVTELKSFYKSDVWILLANVISADTATGPNQERPRNWAISNFEDGLADYPDNLINKREVCMDNDLLPTVEDFPSHNDGLSEKIDNVLAQIDNKNE